MLDPGAWTSRRTKGWWIPPVPTAGVAAASGGVPDELDQEEDPGGRGNGLRREAVEWSRGKT